MADKSRLEKFCSVAAPVCIGVVIGLTLSGRMNFRDGDDDDTQRYEFHCYNPEDNTPVITYRWLASAVQDMRDATAWELTLSGGIGLPPTRVYYRQPEWAVCIVHPMHDSTFPDTDDIDNSNDSEG